MARQAQVGKEGGPTVDRQWTVITASLRRWTQPDVPRAVPDPVAKLAPMTAESGAEKLQPRVTDQAAASGIDLAEVQGKLVGWGWAPDEAWEGATGTVREIAPFTAEPA